MLEPTSVLWLPRHGQVTRSATPRTPGVGKHVLSGTQSSSGSHSCWNYYFSKVFARGNWLRKSSFWFWLDFHRVINLGKHCFTHSRLLRSCANSAPSCETNKKETKPIASILLLSFPQFIRSLGASQTAYTYAQRRHLAIIQRTVTIQQPAGLLNCWFGQEGKKIAKCQGKLRKKFR